MKRILLFIVLFLTIHDISSQNLLTNGDFEGGGNGTGFNSSGTGYTEITTPTGVSVPADFALVTNPATFDATYTAGADHTATGTGNMLVINGSLSNTGQPLFWEAGNTAGGTICGLTVGRTYVFSYWVESVSAAVINSATTADLRLDINNSSAVTLVQGTALAPLPVAGWQQVSYSFVATAACIHIGLWNNNTSAIGNDFAVDDFSLTNAATVVATSASACLNSAAPNVLFASNVGTAPFTFTYNINSGTNITTVVAAGNTLSVPVSTTTPGPVVYNLVSIAYGSAPVITINETATTTVTIIPPPTASMAVNAHVASGILPGEAASINFTGTAGATVNFTSTLGAASVVLNAFGNASYNIPYIAQTAVFTLVSVTTATSPTTVACTASISGTVTVPVILNTCAVPLAELAIDAPSTVCYPGACVDLTAHYSNVGSTTDYVVSPIPYCPTFPFTGGLTIPATGDDAWSPVINLPFEFNFYGVCYDQVLVGTNGLITFDLANQVPLGFCEWNYQTGVPNAAFPIKNAIYGVYQDTDIRAGVISLDAIPDAIQNVNYYVLNTGVNAAPNRVMVANFNELPLFQCNSGSGVQTSQIVIHETTNIIEVYVNKRTPCTSWVNPNGMIGVQNQAGTAAVTAPGRNSGTWSANNEAWRFYPKNNTASQITWQENGNPIGAVNENPLHICPSVASTYTATVTYTNCGTTTISQSIAVPIAPQFAVNSPVGIPVCDTGSPYTVNIDQTAAMLSGVSNPGNYLISYYDNEVDAVYGSPTNINYFSEADLQTYTFNTLPQTIYVRIENLTSTGCINVRPFVISAAVNPAGTFSYVGTPFCNDFTAPITVTGSSISSGGTYSATPTGLILNATTGEISPGSAAGSYTVTYSITPTLPCLPFSTTANIVINPKPDAGTDGGTSICDTNTTAVNLFSLITGEQIGGTWVRSSGTGGTFDATTGTFTAASGAITSTFTYTVAGTAPCVNDNSLATVTILPQPNAGTSGATTICFSSTTTIDLYSLITGEQTGGTWVRTTGTGGVFDPVLGTFTPDATAVTSTFTYTLTGTTPCGNSSSVATVNIVAQPNAGGDGGTTVCFSSTTPVDLYSLITGEQPGGTWVRTTGTGGTFSAAAGTFTPDATATTSTFTYTIAGTLPCVSDSSIATVNVSAQPSAGVDGGITVCDSSTTAIDLFSLITSEQPGGTWVRTTGTGGTFSAATGSYTPASAATTSTFTYTIVGTSPCSNSSSIATVTINPLPNAGTSGSTTVCESSTTAIVLSGLITGEQAGGTWVRSTGTGGTFDAVTGTYTPASGATTSTFTYTIAGTLPCPDASSVVTVNILAQPDAGADGGTTVCDSDATAIDLFSLITGEQSGGTWVRSTGTGGTFNAVIGTYTPALTATTSTFTYTIPGTTPCIADSSLATVTINPQRNPGTDGGTTVCDSSAAPVNLFGLITGEEPGGTWLRTSGTGGTFNAAAGTFTPASGAVTSTFTYTLTGVTPCPNVSSIATVNINPQPDAGTDGGTTVCDSDTTIIDLFSLIGGEQTGGTWARTTGTGGVFDPVAGTFTPALLATTSTFTYTIIGTTPCVNDSSLATITINAQNNAGTDGATTVCDSSTLPISLFGLITGEQLGGTWVRTSGTGGTFNAAAATFTPASGATTSTFTYTITGTTPCPNVSSLATVNINPQPVAGTDGGTTVCDSSTTAINLFSLITGEQPGGAWVRSTGTGGNFDAIAGTYTPSPAATTSTFTYTIIGTAPCIDDSSIATITIIAQPDAGVAGATTVCDSSNTPINLFSLITGEQPGGTWVRSTGTGGIFNAAAATYTPAPNATTSTFTYTLTGTLPCSNSSSIATININAQPNAGTSGATTVCDSSTAAINLFGLITGEQLGGIWVRTTGTGGVFNAAAGTYTPAPSATTSTFTYTITGTTPCIDSSSVATVNINPQPNAGTDGNTTVCDNSTVPIDLFSLITAEQSGGTWVRSTGTGGTFNATAGTYIPAPSATTSTFTYTIAGTTPCVADNSVATIVVNAVRNAGIDGSTTVCDSSTASINLFGLIIGEQSGGAWVRTSGTGGTFNAAAATFTPARLATTSTFTYTLNGTTPCPNVFSTATVVVNPQPDAGLDGNIAVCESNTASIDLYSIISGEQSGGTWVRTTGSGGTFNAIAGSYTPGIGASSSTFTYTITAGAPCLSDSSIAAITINPAATIVLTLGNGNQTVCINTPIQPTIYTVGNGATGATITSGGLPAGVTGVFNPATGTFTVSGTPTDSGAFHFQIDPTSTCSGTPISGTIVVNPRVTMVLSSLAATPFQKPCVSTLITPITYLVGSGATGAIATGLPPGLVQNYNAATHTLTISGVVSTVGIYNFDVHTVGGCGPDVFLSGSIEVVKNATIVLNSIAGTDHQNLCIEDQISDIRYLVGDGATGASITSGAVPTGIQGSFSAGLFTISGTPTESGTFIFTITTSGGCATASLTASIVVNALPKVYLPDGFICVDETGNPLPGATNLFDTRLLGNYTFVWSDENGVISGANTSSYEATVPGVYTVEVTDNNTHCSNSTSATVFPGIPPLLVNVTVSDYFADHQIIIVSVEPPGIYEYQLDNGPFQDSNQFVGFTSGTHQIMVRDKFLCGQRPGTVTVIDFPKFFTPNGDGYNDTWNITDLKDLPDNQDSKIYIFDRYGKLIKEISPLGEGWDGTFNNNMLPATDYWFKVFFKEKGASKEFKSHFSLKR